MNIRSIHTLLRLLPITIGITLGITLGIVPAKGQSDESVDKQTLRVALRMVGHQLLLQAGDSLSRVLPIAKENGRWRVALDTELSFDPEDLVTIVDSVLRQAELKSSYILEVEACETGQMVYSHRMGAGEQADLVPCRSRVQPQGCYNLLFTFPPGAKPASTPLSRRRMMLPALALPAMLLLGLWFIHRKQQEAKAEAHLIELGNFRFDPRNMELSFDEERISLTGKEAELLLLLHEAANTTLEREFILNQVWQDEGDYVGRTLDVFISNLRKKLQADPRVKIVNIRGVGYKLVVNG